MVLRNTFWNMIALAAEIGAGFLIAPLLIARLGNEAYGTWVMLASVVSFLTLLDLGVRATVARMIAFHRAKDDAAKASESLSSALALLSLFGFLAAGLMSVAGAWFVGPLGIPPELFGSAQMAMIAMGVSVGLTLVLSPFDAVLWATQRFDWMNMVNIPVTLIRSILVAVIAITGGGLAELGAVTLGTVLIGGVAKLLLATHAAPSVRIRTCYVTHRGVRELLGTSMWVLAGTIARMFRLQIGPVMISVLLGAALVTPFSVANRIATLPTAVLMTLATVVGPIATKAFAQNRLNDVHHIMTTLGKYLFTLALAVVMGVIIIGPSILAQWVGSELASVASTLLIILVIGEGVSNSQLVSQAILGAALRFRWMAVLAAVELVAMGILACILVRPLGILGLCLAIAIPGCFSRGLGLLIGASREISFPLRRYFTKVILPAMMALAGPVVALALGRWWHEPGSWTELVGYSVGYAVLLAGSALIWFPEVRSHPIIQRLAPLKHLARNERPSPPTSA